MIALRLALLLGTIVLARAAIEMEIPTVKQRTPIILIPGDGGSRIYAKINSPSYLCPGKKDWFLIWLNADFLIPMTEYCFPKYFKLQYNRTDRKTYDQPGVQTAIWYWGNTTSIEMLDTVAHSFAIYFASTAEMLVQKAGYKRGIDLRGAPFDFRRAPNDNVDFVPKMKALIENTYEINGKERVMLLAHSLGNLYILYFLKAMTPTWKKKYVRTYLAVSAPLGGSVKPLKLETYGDTLNAPILFSSYMREVERSMPSTTFLMPSPKFWRPDEVLVSRPGRNYTVANYKQLFDDMKFTDGWEMYKDTSTLFDPLWVPDIDELYCIHGSGKDTAEQLVWKSDSEFPDYAPKAIPGPGDGTVNLRSLYVCRRWPKVKWSEIDKVGHQEILTHPEFLRQLFQIVASKDIKRDPHLL